jgi:hypothetical protein
VVAVLVVEVVFALAGRVTVMAPVVVGALVVAVAGACVRVCVLTFAALPDVPEPPHADSPAVMASELTRAASSDQRRPRTMLGRTGGLLQALARLAHERDCFRKDDRHHRAQLLGLLLRRALDVDAIDRRHGEIDREFDGVVGPRESLSALHLLGELPEPALQIVGVAEESAEAASFHDVHGSSPMLVVFEGLMKSGSQRGAAA